MGTNVTYGSNGLDSFQAAEQQLAQGTTPAPDSTPPPGSSEAEPAEGRADARLMAYLDEAQAPDDIRELARTTTTSDKKFTELRQGDSREKSELKEQLRYVQGQLSAAQAAPVQGGEEPLTKRQRLLETSFPGDTPEAQNARKLMGEMFDDVQQETYKATMAAMQPTQAAVAASNIRAAEAEYKAEARKRLGAGVDKYWPQMWQSTIDGVKAGLTPDPEAWLSRNHFDEYLKLANSAKQETVVRQPAGMEAHTRPAHSTAAISHAVASGDPERGPAREAAPRTKADIMLDVNAAMRAKYPDNPMWRD